MTMNREVLDAVPTRVTAKAMALAALGQRQNQFPRSGSGRLLARQR
jgi:hypothetical protein